MWINSKQLRVFAKVCNRLNPVPTSLYLVGDQHLYRWGPPKGKHLLWWQLCWGTGSLCSRIPVHPPTCSSSACYFSVPPIDPAIRVCSSSTANKHVAIKSNACFAHQQGGGHPTLPCSERPPAPGDERIPGPHRHPNRTNSFRTFKSKLGRTRQISPNYAAVC